MKVPGSARSDQAKTTNLAGPLRVRCHELAPVLGDVTTNLRAIAGSIARAAQDGIDLLVLPELATSGYHLRSRSHARSAAIAADGTELSAVAAVVPDGMHVVAGFCESVADAVFSSAVVIASSGVVTVYRKTHLWGEERMLFDAGDQPAPVVDLGRFRLGVLVCFDLEYPEMPRSLALRGADMIAAPVNWPRVPRPAGERPPELIQAMGSARASGVAIACCDRSGLENGEEWTRGSGVVSQEGWVISTESSEKNGQRILDASVPLATSRDVRVATIVGRRPELYSVLDSTRL
jgi:predicted amidohydrolase